MITGLSSYAFRNIQFNTIADVKWLCDFAISNKVGLLQLSDNINIGNLGEKEFRSLSSSVNGKIRLELGFKVASYSELIEAIDISIRFSVKRIRVVLSFERLEDSFLYNKECFDSIIDLLDMGDITLMIENHMENDPIEIISFIEYARRHTHRFSVCFDCYNSLVHDFSSYDGYELFKKYISEVHIKDITVRRDSLNLVFSGCELGKGILDCSGFIERFVQDGFHDNLPFILESWIVSPDYDSECELVKREIAYLKEVIDNAV